MRGQEHRIVVISLRRSGYVRHLLEERVGLIDLTRVSIRVRQQTGRAVGVVLRIARYHPLQVRRRGGKVAQLNFGNTPPVESIR